MDTKRRTVKHSAKWYTDFIEYASQLGTVDPKILERNRGVVEMLRKGAADDDPEGAAYAYMKLQERDQKIGGSLEKDNERRKRDMALQGTTPEIQAAFNTWFESFVDSL
jgi:hypothetical protein